MFEKILIANRGEIAARIIRSCKKLGIKTVAVYSDADRQAKFVDLADESYHIGPAPVSKSYMNIEKVIAAAKQSGSEAVHPGYGLLSEQASFAEACELESLTFIGPKPAAIEKMGSKVMARQTMKDAGIPIVPGSSNPVTDVEEAAAIAEKIGYPVMIKASAGGGGIGMVLADNLHTLREKFPDTSKRAAMLFGDGTMFIEKVIPRARHIEVQLLADSYGNVVHLFERECSIQRRHQKVIEEAPSGTVQPALREKLGMTAMKAARAIGYENAGTIEFLMDEEQNFYFLEMNTRLQVEHPVTEEITGVDIVEEQIKIAAGHSLGMKQDSMKINGHAIEVRIYAEDPYTFYPSPGRITSLKLPEGKGIRHELAVREGSEVTPYYDPMIGKLVVSAASRKEAIRLLKEALDHYQVDGIKTNIPMLKEIVRHEQFEKSNTLTSFIEDYYLKGSHNQKEKEKSK
ncbi:acetyl-CoA carboxylase biotin carboxylase subunit [Sediminibacillus dalangtanensis]|uniref:biotin carboxylase n=1 Tax=Sediminibacillus dalangtanensis TaxID=2729421 RepID=A0ABX7VSN5_9BACI|nr:acetyl-CoA carboxylase biotin carboxylase subunit [Sediminibacillus dalangtanensis]QTM99528.1 acetyl-CoA carboxylase biotin carboxylase subunit [Sediminibacillus dalangtanensis]